MTATNIRPQRNPAPAPPQADKRPSPRDPRRIWGALMPRAETFTNARARELAEWADAVGHEDTFAAWVDAHPNAGAAPAELRR